MPTDKITPAVARVAESFFSGPTPMERALATARTQYYDRQAEGALAKTALARQEQAIKSRILGG